MAQNEINPELPPLAWSWAKKHPRMTDDQANEARARRVVAKQAVDVVLDAGEIDTVSVPLLPQAGDVYVATDAPAAEPNPWGAKKV